jgi:hypothetical protein
MYWGQKLWNNIPSELNIYASKMFYRRLLINQWSRAFGAYITLGMAV